MDDWSGATNPHTNLLNTDRLHVHELAGRLAAVHAGDGPHRRRLRVNELARAAWQQFASTRSACRDAQPGPAGPESEERARLFSLLYRLLEIWLCWAGPQAPIVAATAGLVATRGEPQASLLVSAMRRDVLRGHFPQAWEFHAASVAGHAGDLVQLAGLAVPDEGLWTLLAEAFAEVVKALAHRGAEVWPAETAAQSAATFAAAIRECAAADKDPSQLVALWDASTEDPVIGWELALGWAPVLASEVVSECLAEAGRRAVSIEELSAATGRLEREVRAALAWSGSQAQAATKGGAT